MDESELAAVVLALRQLQPASQPQAPAISAWRRSARLPELEFDDLLAIARVGRDVS